MAMVTIMTTISKEQFLIEHNKLSPANLQATLALLNRFKEEKKPLLKDNAWSIDKLRIPFISWLLALPEKEKLEGRRKKEKEIFRNYPETHYQA
jgi:hypothetical protein